jgi:hypothetical protein
MLVPIEAFYSKYIPKITPNIKMTAKTTSSIILILAVRRVAVWARKCWWLGCMAKVLNAGLGG